jgi:poly-gamma-glutamate synthesis protein (capsule biosynthesis protein)
MNIIKKLLFLLVGILFVAGIILLVFFLVENLKKEEKVRFEYKREGDGKLETVEIQKEEESKEVSMVFVGDIMLSRDVARKMKSKGENYPFLETFNYLKGADLVFGNLETSITEGREIQTNEMVFRADPGVEKVLKEANFQVLSLANNHTPNFFKKGLLDTFRYLDEAQIQYVGAGENEERAYSPVYLEKNGINFAFLAYNDSDVVPNSYRAGIDQVGTAFMDLKRLKEGVEEAQKNAEIVIVSMHSGKEYVLEPNDSQKEFAHAAIDYGADLVIGHHPHVVQIAEKYKGKYIFYSLGNFVFDQMWSEETKEGLMVKVYFDKAGVKNLELKPVLIQDYAQPMILEGERAQKIIERLKLD